MGTHNPLAVSHSGRIHRPVTTQLARPTPPSPMVMQQFMQLLAALNQKVDALAVRNTQLPQVISVQTELPDRTEAELQRTESPAPMRQAKVQRSGLLEMFD